MTEFEKQIVHSEVELLYRQKRQQTLTGLAWKINQGKIDKLQIDIKLARRWLQNA